MTAEPFTLSKSDFDVLFDKLKNWGRWGDDDDLGTLNFLGEGEVVAAAGLVRSGRRVSLARALDTVAGPDNGRPALHYMTSMGDQRQDESAYYADFIGVDFHGKSASHLDSLVHVAYKGLLYNGKRAADVVGSKGTSFGAVSRLARGIVARGVLLDAARARKVDWVEPPCALGAEDLGAIAATLGLEVRRGDVVFLRTGQVRRRSVLGPWDPDLAEAGLATSGLEWLAEREIAVLGSDGDSDARPSPVEGIGGPIHVLSVAALGMCLLDNLDLESVSEACAEEGRFEFLVVVAPLVVPGGTGSPVNPIAVF
jgi:kynurenine formamidase